MCDVYGIKREVFVKYSVDCPSCGLDFDIDNVQAEDNEFPFRIACDYCGKSFLVAPWHNRGFYNAE